MKVKPIGERALLKVIKNEEITKLGIIIPESAQEDKKEGIIVAIGINHPELKINDRVMYGGYSNEDFEINGIKHVIVEIKDIVAKIDHS